MAEALPMPPLVESSARNWALVGKRARHRHLRVYGRLTGEIRFSRGVLWAQVDAAGGTCWWLARSIDLLGPIAVPTGVA